MDAVALRPAALRGAATRDALLDAAETLIADHGFTTPSHRMIAGQAGTHVALVNYHFGSKEMLFEAAVERRAVRLNDQWTEALAQMRTKPSWSVGDVLRGMVAAIRPSRGRERRAVDAITSAPSRVWPPPPKARTGITAISAPPTANSAARSRRLCRGRQARISKRASATRGACSRRFCSIAAARRAERAGRAATATTISRAPCASSKAACAASR